MMSLAWNWVAIALSLTAAAPTGGNPGVGELGAGIGKLRQVAGEPRNPGRITYEVRVVETEGLGWREACFESLTPVARRGTATIWTAPSHVLRPIIEKAKVVVAPKLTATPQGAAHISLQTDRKWISQDDGPWEVLEAGMAVRANRKLITQVSWDGDDPSAGSEAVRERFATTIIGRRLDQGVLVQIVIDDTEVRGIHTVKLASHEDRAEYGIPSGQPGKVFKKIEKAPRVLQVPEVSSQEILGEWLIPNDGMLVVGFGIYMAAGTDGKAVARERLVLIRTADHEVKQTALRDRESAPSPSAIPAPVAPTPSVPPATVTPTPSAVPVTPTPSAVPAPAPPANAMPTPDIPSRTLPQGLNADGTPAELPPLPDDTPASEADESAEPHGSPQHRKKDQPIPMPTVPKPEAKDKGKSADGKATKAAYIPGRRESTPAIGIAVREASETVFSPGKWSPAKLRSIPNSLGQWIEFVQARGSMTKDCAGDSDCCEESACPDECKDEE